MLMRVSEFTLPGDICTTTCEGIFIGLVQVSNKLFIDRIIELRSFARVHTIFSMYLILSCLQLSNFSLVEVKDSIYQIPHPFKSLLIYINFSLYAN